MTLTVTSSLRRTHGHRDLASHPRRVGRDRLVGVLVDRREDALERRLAAERAAALVDVRLELVAELVDVARDRHRGRVAERAEALAEDPVADVEQQVELGLLRASPASILWRICTIQRVPSRHGVHLPHDSCM